MVVLTAVEDSNRATILNRTRQSVQTALYTICSTNGFLDPSVLDAFEEVKNATDNYMGESNFESYPAEWMPTLDEISIGIFCNALGELGCPIQSAAPGTELARITPSPSHEKLVNHMYGQLARKHLIEISHGAIVRTDVPCPSEDR